MNINDENESQNTLYINLFYKYMIKTNRCVVGAKAEHGSIVLN